MDKKEIFMYEKKKLESVIELINKQLREAENKFSNEQHTKIGYTEGLRGTQFTRQAFMSHYATEIDKLKSVLSNPYFGMFQFKGSDDTKEIYLGKRGIIGENGVSVVYDWRSPICSMYYDYNLGDAEYVLNDGTKEKGELLKKRQLIIKKGELLDVAEEDILSNDSVLLR